MADELQKASCNIDELWEIETVSSDGNVDDPIFFFKICCTEIKMNCLDSKRSTEASTSEGLDQFKANDDESTANAKGDFDANVSTLQDSHTLSNSRLMAFKLEWNGWASRTTFHGIVNIVDNGLLLIRRIVWFVLIVAGVYGLVSNTVSQTQRFLEYRTLTQDTIFYDPDLKLPAVTVCSMNTLDSTSFTDKRDLVILRNLYVGMSNRSALLEYPGEEYVKNVSLKELFRSGFMPSNKTFRSCFRPRGGTLVDCVPEIRLTNLGHCHTMYDVEAPKSTFVLADSTLSDIFLLLWTNQDDYFVSYGMAAGFK
ncbi:hypothetical protein MAR_023365, partial [Mya arenaria]